MSSISWSGAPSMAMPFLTTSLPTYRSILPGAPPTYPKSASAISPGPLTMQPMTAMDTPGRWPVFSRICSVTSWRSNRVLPQDGQLTYSVLIFLIRQPWSRPNEVFLTNSKSSVTHSITRPSPRPSTIMAPTWAPEEMMISSLSVPSGKVMWWTTGVWTSFFWNTSNTLLDACTLDTPGAIFKRATSGLISFRAASCSSVSVPSTKTAKWSPAPSTFPELLKASAATLSCIIGMAPSKGVALRVSAGAMTFTPTSWSLRSALQASASEALGGSYMMIVSDVAMSLNGMPTASLHPSFLYIVSGSARSAAVMTLKTLPSLCRICE
mmetsp:Transcript_10435/g.28485  ORF Transcript_10435/g.28485 Transcript_10435/m.28485 type:complete len:324 (-) Transcript_10435:1272-2243(-)